MTIQIDVSEKNEATAYPWWAILNPRMGGMSAHNISSTITGPFFSRESAEEYLQAKSHRFSPKAEVWCLSGHESRHYRAAIDAARAAGR